MYVILSVFITPSIDKTWKNVFKTGALRWSDSLTVQQQEIMIG